MTRITDGLLRDTLSLVALAREAALARGDQERANRLEPVERGLHSLVTRSQSPAGSRPHGLLAEEGFRALLQVAQAERSAGLSGGEDRRSLAAAMAAGGMSEVDIARHLGVTREEVRLLLARPGAAGGKEVRS